MFLNESINVKDSAIFMGFMRQALVENLKEKNADYDTIEYITEQAQDCEILSLAMYGKICPTENPVFAETYLLSNLKNFVLENINNLPFTDNYTPTQFIHEIGPLSVLDTDSMTMIQEGFVLQEGIADKLKFAKNVVTHGYNRAAASRNATASGPGFNSKEGQTWGRIMSSDRSGAPVGAEDNDSINASGNQGAMAQSNASGQADNPTQQGHAGVDSLMFNLRKVAGNVGEGLSKAWSNFTQYIKDTPTGKTIGAAALIGAAGFLAYKAYQRYFSQAAKSCAGKSGAERTACIANAKKQAVKQQINMLRKSMNGCKAASNPAECKQKINSKIMKLQSKL